MPELPEVETVRRMLDAHVLGRTVLNVRLSGKKLRTTVSPAAMRRVAGRRIEATGRHGKYLFIHFDGGLTLLSHLGMSGRWLFDSPDEAKGDRNTSLESQLPHVHAILDFSDGARLRFQDPRRFGFLRVVATDRLKREPELAKLGPDPVVVPPKPDDLAHRARGRRVAVKSFLLDQSQIAGIGNIYASEILHRAGVHPSRHAGLLSDAEWSGVTRHTSAVLGEAIARMGTTFSSYRTLWNEPGEYGDQLRVYDRGGKPCRTCGTAIRRSVIGQRSTFFCPSCQPARAKKSQRK